MMKKINLSLIAVTSCLLMGITQDVFANEQTLFNMARESFRKNNALQLDIQASLFDKNSVLYPYIEYWQLNLKINTLSYLDIINYRNKYPMSYLAEKLLIDWLNAQAEQQQWNNVLKYQITPDTSLNSDQYQCSIIKANYFSKQNQEDMLNQSKNLWYSVGTNHVACDELFSELFKKQGLITEDVWQRVRMNYENISLKTLQALVESYFDDRSISKDFANYFNNAEKMLLSTIDSQELRQSIKTDYRFKELLILSFVRMTRINLDKSVNYWIELEQYFDERDRAFVWGQIATQATKVLHQNAFQWFLYVPLGYLSEVQIEWRIRASLRQKDWIEVLKGIEFLSPTGQQEATWRYWKAIALSQIDGFKNNNLIKELLENLAKDHTYYGQLAREELYLKYNKDLYNNYDKIVNKISKPSQFIKDSVQKNTGIQRAMALFAVGYPGDGMREWLWTTRYFTDTQLLASADIAMQQQWYERAINTANRTKNEHDFSLRYPTLFRNYTKNYSDFYKIDEAWVYGIIRQESRFMLKTRSSVGAMGLMQLMPQTAKQIASELNTDFNQQDLFQPNQNILFGVYYLNSIWKDLDYSQVLATAGYNAGPHRAKQWKPKEDDSPIDGAIYVETIPFNETRNYVKQVLTNSIYYSYRLNMMTPEKNLKKRLGSIHN